MSKSKGTGVAPGDMAEIYGVDTLRMAIMFGAPPEKDLNFDEKQLESMKSYLDRVSTIGDKISAILNSTTDHDLMFLTDTKPEHLKSNPEFVQILKLLKDYSLKINEQRYFHVAIARLMEVTNILRKQYSTSDNVIDFKSFRTLLNGYLLLITSLYPFAPHLSSELWLKLSSQQRKEQLIGVLPELAPLLNESDLRNVKCQNCSIETLIEIYDPSSSIMALKISINGKYVGKLQVNQDIEKGGVLKAIQDDYNQNPK